MKSGTRLNTPHLSKMFASDEDSYLAERLAAEGKSIDNAEDFENYEDEVCGKCHGTGQASPEHPEDDHCVACEGTGLWYRLYYGISNGVPFAYTDEWGIPYLKEVCKEYRSAHTQQQLAGKPPTNLRPYLLPKTLEMELMARGLDARTEDPDEKRYVMNVIASEYPDFMACNYKRF